jgi:hypothetical protein
MYDEHDKINVGYVKPHWKKNVQYFKEVKKYVSRS